MPRASPARAASFPSAPAAADWADWAAAGGRGWLPRAGASAGRWPCDTATAQPRWPHSCQANPGGTHSASHPPSAAPPELGETPAGQDRGSALGWGCGPPEGTPRDCPHRAARGQAPGVWCPASPLLPAAFPARHTGTADPPSALRVLGGTTGTPWVAPRTGVTPPDAASVSSLPPLCTVGHMGRVPTAPRALDPSGTPQGATVGSPIPPACSPAQPPCPQTYAEPLSSHRAAQGGDKEGGSPQPFGNWHFLGPVPASSRARPGLPPNPPNSRAGRDRDTLLHNPGQQLLSFLGSCNVWLCHSHLKRCQGLGWAAGSPASCPAPELLHAPAVPQFPH